jgi:hypothetical protein
VTAVRWCVAALAVLAVAAAPAGAARKPGCGPGAARTVKQSSTIRVFVQKRAYFACWRRSHGTPVDLADGAIGPIRLRGRFLTFATPSACAHGCEFDVTILDVERRAAVVYAYELPGILRTLVATRGGAAAFLADNGSEQYVEKLDSLGPEEIDRGPDVRALTLHRGRLHWIHGNVARDDHIAHVRRCGRVDDTQTLALSRNARVYSTPQSTDYGTYRYYGCLLGGGKPLFLSSEDAVPSTARAYPDLFQLAGHHVFWFEYSCYLGGCTTELRTADLVERAKRSGDLHSRQGDPSLYPNRRGFAGLLYPPTDGFPDYQLYGFDSAGQRLLDESAGIDPSSIAVYPDALVWRDNGELRSAPLR